jgi:hypothetical protein
MSQNFSLPSSITSKTMRYGNVVHVLEYPDNRKIHIDDDGHVYDWLDGYASICCEYTDVLSFNLRPNNDVYTGTVDHETHLRQGKGVRRFFNDQDAVDRYDNNNKHLFYMYQGDFVNGDMHGSGELMFNDGTTLNGTWENNYLVQNEPCVFTWPNEDRYEGLANERLLSIAAEYVHVFFDDEEDHMIVEEEIQDEALLKRKSMREK